MTAATGSTSRQQATSIDEFRAEVRDFLDRHAERRPPSTLRWGEGSDRVSIFAESTPDADARHLAAVRAWRRTVFDAGLGWITGPVEYGGRGLPAEYGRAYSELERGYLVPSQTVFGITYGMVAPTTAAWGTDLAKQRFLAGFYRGDVLGCQLFSEPSAGSDVAGLRTRAVRDGDEWIVDGQKVWTSGAHLADVGLLLARTNIDAPKHRGLTMFLIDMHQPGVEVRPLRQMTGGSSFNEVFLTAARIPDAYRLGAVDDGWNVAISTLMHERAFAADANRVSPLELLTALVRHVGADRDPVVRQAVADVWISSQVANLNAQRATAKLRAGQVPGPEMSIGKLQLTTNLQRMSELVSLVLGPRLVADTGAWGTYSWSEFVLSVPGVRLGGGTDEVQRNIIAERVLGLPKEPKAG